MIKRKVVFGVNLLLLLVIALFAYIKFYKVNLSFDCEHGNRPAELLEAVKEHFPGFESKELKAVFLFNDIPEIGVLDTVSKIYYLYKDYLSFGVIFSQRFRSDSEFRFPFKKMPRYKFSCNKKKGSAEKSYFLLLYGEEIIHSTNALDFFGFNFAVQKRLNPGLTIASARLPIRKLKAGVIQRVKEEGLELLDVNTDAIRRFEGFSEFSQIYFFHADCSGCQLKRIIQDIKLLRILNQEKVVIVFSIFANPSELKLLLAENGVDLPVYVDISDEFCLAAKITDDKENPLIITAEDLKEGA